MAVATRFESVSLGTTDALAAVFALNAVETARDSRRRVLAQLIAIRLAAGVSEAPEDEETVAIQVAALDRFARQLRTSLFGDPTLAYGEHFVGVGR